MNSILSADSAIVLNEPNNLALSDDCISFNTKPNTDFWQRTYYGFRNDNGHCVLWETNEEFFTLTVKASADTAMLYDQCGVMLYQDSDNWFKASAEYADEETQKLGSVVTNDGWSDWASSNISAAVKEIWYRLSRRGSDFCVEASFDGCLYGQMRIFHLLATKRGVRVGFYACSPMDSSFTARFTDFLFGDCVWRTEP